MSAASDVVEFYSNDVVCRFDKRKRIVFGMVIDSYEASNDSDDYNSLPKGHIRIWWLNSSREQVWRQNRVQLVSRSVIPGDIVRRLEHGKETQRGYCKESRQFATVQIVGTDKVIEKVPSERLKNVNPYDISVAVCLGDKYGRVQSMDQLVTMQSKCGSVVSVLSSINHIEDYWLTKRNRRFFDSFYPGQEVTCTPSNLEQPVWIHKSKSMRKGMQSRHRFTVQKVESTDIEVQWFDCDTVGYISKTEDLKSEDIKKLKVVEPLENCFLELAERRLLKLSSSDVISRKRDWIRKQSALHRSGGYKTASVKCRNTRSTHNKFRTPSLLSTCVDSQEQEDDSWTSADNENDSGSASSSCSTPTTNFRKKHFPPKAREIVPGHTLPVEVLCMDSKATIVWQDGTEEKDIPTTQLYYSMSLDDHEFFPGEWVVIDGDKEEPGQRYGAVQQVNCLERTATVKWFKCDEKETKPETVEVNEMSVYDLKKHSKYEFRPGIVVKRKPTEENKLGYVLDSCPEGYVLIRWIDGSEEKCWPQNIELIPESADYTFSMDDNDDEDGQVSWETESIESVAGDISDETTLQNMAARLDFVRNRIIYLKEAFRQHSIPENFAFLRDLLIVYDNSSYLDKLLDTSFFSLKSKHFQTLLMQVKDRAKSFGIELRGRLFVSDYLCPSSTKLKIAEKENINKVIKLEHRVNAQIESTKEGSKESGEPSTPLTPESTDYAAAHLPPTSENNLCIELLSMLKTRMDLAYAEIISRIGGSQALSVMTKASDKTIPPSSSTPMIPTTPDSSFSNISPLKLLSIENESESFAILDEAHVSHHYYCSSFEPTDKSAFFRAVQRENKLLHECLPPGVWVRAYANRLDLLSVMIRGPNKTPYEDGLFLFDIQLSPDFPRSPPLCHYISYSSERLNPNLYVDGKVCVSLLGTWMGRGTEVWGPKSTLLQLIVSIQGLILVSEPYYNEAGYEKQTESQQGCENSRTYNEFVLLKLVQSMAQMLRSPPEVFRREVLSHFAANGAKMCRRLTRFCGDAEELKPDFPLLPVSKGLKLSLTAALGVFREVLEKAGREEGGGD